MDPAAAAYSAAREPGGRYGDLQPLARQALAPRVSRIETALRLNAQPAGRAGAAPAAGASSAPERLHTAELRRERRGDRPLQENPAYSPASLRSVAQPDVRTDPAAAPEGFDGESLREAQAELRGLRADVAQLARALGRPLRDQSTLTEYRGVIQQYDQLDSDVQRMWFDQERELATSPRREMEYAVRQGEARQLARKQEQLLEALRRAERRLEEAPEQVLPPGVREAVIGEILRARHSAALFGGLTGSALVTGRLASAVA